MNWYYHFSNVNDGGNRVPLFWLPPHGGKAEIVDTPVSSRFIYQSLLEYIGIPQDTTLFKNQTLNFPLIQSYWYKHQGGTCDLYKYNQFLFSHDNMRYVKRNQDWMQAPITDDAYHQEAPFERMNLTNPIEELVNDAEKKNYLREKIKEFDIFSLQAKI